MRQGATAALNGAALALTRACARAAETAPAGSALRDHAAEAATTLAAVLDRGFTDADLAEWAATCRALIVALLSSQPEPPGVGRGQHGTSQPG